MNQVDWKLVGFIAVGLSIVFLLVGAVASLTTRRGDYIYGGLYKIDYPYQTLGVGLLVAGGSLLALGAAFVWRGRIEQLPPPP